VTNPIDRKEIQTHLDSHRDEWGQSSRYDPRNLWQLSEPDVTLDEAVSEGERHSCRVIAKAAVNKSTLTMLRSYGGKNRAFQNVSQLLEEHNPRLHKDWNSAEVRRRKEHTHPDIQKIAQLPTGVNPRQLNANARLIQYDVPDHFKTLDHIVHGQTPSQIHIKPGDESKYHLPLEIYIEPARLATNLPDFAARVAHQTAVTLHQREVDTRDIANLLSLNFAQTGIIQEYGQQKPASRLVDHIIATITREGKLPGLARAFRETARPKVQKSYLGKRNPRLD